MESNLGLPLMINIINDDFINMHNGNLSSDLLTVYANEYRNDRNNNKSPIEYRKLTELVNMRGMHIPRERYVLSDCEFNVREYEDSDIYIPPHPAAYNCHRKLFPDISMINGKIEHMEMRKHLTDDEIPEEKWPRWFKVNKAGAKTTFTPRDVRDKSTLHCIVLVQINVEPSLYYPVLIKASTPTSVGINHIYNNFFVESQVNTEKIMGVLWMIELMKKKI